MDNQKEEINDVNIEKSEDIKSLLAEVHEINNKLSRITFLMMLWFIITLIAFYGMFWYTAH